MDVPGEFSVFQFFPDGTSECLKRGTDAKTAVETARSYTRPNRPGVVIGAIDRVIITDGGDCCCFEWKNGQGVTFPARSEREGLRPCAIPSLSPR